MSPAGGVTCAHDDDTQPFDVPHAGTVRRQPHRPGLGALRTRSIVDESLLALSYRPRQAPALSLAARTLQQHIHAGVPWRQTHELCVLCLRCLYLLLKVCSRGAAGCGCADGDCCCADELCTAYRHKAAAWTWSFSFLFIFVLSFALFTHMFFALCSVVVHAATAVAARVWCVRRRRGRGSAAGLHAAAAHGPARSASTRYVRLSVCLSSCSPEIMSQRTARSRDCDTRGAQQHVP